MPKVSHCVTLVMNSVSNCFVFRVFCAVETRAKRFYSLLVNFLAIQ
jgi:hypothetical protein